MSEEFLVFTRDPMVGQRFGLPESKKGGIWYQKVDGEAAAAALLVRLGASSWVRSISQMRRRPVWEVYAQPTAEVLAEREVERQRALADFAAGIDWPPWESGEESEQRSRDRETSGANGSDGM